MTRRHFQPQAAGAPGAVYVFAEQIILAVNTALATNRPLLVRGPPGSGKSTLGRAIAAELSWRYYYFAFRSQTRLSDLLYRWDETARLRDSQLVRSPLNGEHNYVEPGVLWWAYSPESAARRGAPPGEERALLADPGSGGSGGSSHAPAVLLLDDVDRGDPDACRDLVDVLGARGFHVRELALHVVPVEPPLAILTSSEERALPPAVTRACVGLLLATPDEHTLLEMGRLHHPDMPVEQLKSIVSRVLELSDDRRAHGAPGPTSAQFLDVVRAFRSLGIEPDDARSQAVLQSVLGIGSGASSEPPAPRRATARAHGCVFICYSRNDEQFVLTLAGALKGPVPSVWLDQWSIPPGADWDAAIDEAIRGCARFIIVLSPNAVASPEVQSELRLALNEKKPIVPVVLEPCQIPRRLTILQHIEVRGRSADDNEFIARLVRALAPV